MASSESDSLRVLVVDDSVVVRQRLRLMIEEQALVEVVGEAADGQQGLEAVRRLRPDAMVLDLWMRGVDGIDLLERVREEKIPVTVIILTNYPLPQYEARCRALGADHFFDKSSQFEKVLSTLGDLAELRGFGTQL